MPTTSGSSSSIKPVAAAASSSSSSSSSSESSIDFFIDTPSQQPHYKFREPWTVLAMDNIQGFLIQLACAGGSGAIAKTAVAPLERAKVSVVCRCAARVWQVCYPGDARDVAPAERAHRQHACGPLTPHVPAHVHTHTTQHRS
jgi:hypothetical protein